MRTRLHHAFRHHSSPKLLENNSTGVVRAHKDIIPLTPSQANSLRSHFTLQACIPTQKKGRMSQAGLLICGSSSTCVSHVLDWAIRRQSGLQSTEQELCLKKGTAQKRHFSCSLFSGEYLTTLDLQKHDEAPREVSHSASQASWQVSFVTVSGSVLPCYPCFYPCFTHSSYFFPSDVGFISSRSWATSTEFSLHFFTGNFCWNRSFFVSFFYCVCVLCLETGYLSLL